MRPKKTSGAACPRRGNLRLRGESLDCVDSRSWSTPGVRLLGDRECTGRKGEYSRQRKPSEAQLQRQSTRSGLAQFSELKCPGPQVEFGRDMMANDVPQKGGLEGLKHFLHPGGMLSNSFQLSQHSATSLLAGASTPTLVPSGAPDRTPCKKAAGHTQGLLRLKPQS